MLLPAAVPPDSRAVMLLTGRGAEPSIDKAVECVLRLKASRHLMFSVLWKPLLVF